MKDVNGRELPPGRFYHRLIWRRVLLSPPLTWIAAIGARISAAQMRAIGF
jgi:hypothetical protein